MYIAEAHAAEEWSLKVSYFFSHFFSHFFENGEKKGREISTFLLQITEMNRKTHRATHNNRVFQSLSVWPLSVIRILSDS